MNQKSIGAKVIIYTLLIIGSIIFILPLLWMLTTALSSKNAIYSFPPKIIPTEFHFENFAEALSYMDFSKLLNNTLIITLLSIVGTLISSTLVAFGFARCDFKGRDLLFFILISTMILPNQVTIIPMYMIFMKLGWINTFKPLIVPAFFGNAFFIFLLRQFFMGIPKSLDEAAYIDGCSTFRIYWNIILPLSVPALVTVTIFCFLWTWNDFFHPLIYLDDAEKFTLTLGLYRFKGSSRTGVQWNLLMAASVIIMLPCLLIFAFFQQYFIEGTVISGLKG